MSPVRLDKRSPIPLYHQLQAIIDARIASGEWVPGRQLPSERELCEEFGVSRITVRQALAALANEGRLARQQGVGTFVAPRRIEQHLNRLTGFTDEMAERGQQPGARLLRLERFPATFAVAHSLRRRPGEPVIVVQRLRLADGEPLALETAYLVDDRCYGLLDEPLQSHSLYRLLSEKYGIVPTRAEQQIEAMACPPPEAQLLDVRKGMPMLHMIRVTYDQDDRPFEHTESFYRGDRYVFHVELVNAGDRTAGCERPARWQTRGGHHGRPVIDDGGIVATGMPERESSNE
jgi:GntR family transcriptional regulator